MATLQHDTTKRCDGSTLLYWTEVHRAQSWRLTAGRKHAVRHQIMGTVRNYREGSAQGVLLSDSGVHWYLRRIVQLFEFSKTPSVVYHTNARLSPKIAHTTNPPERLVELNGHERGRQTFRAPRRQDASWQGGRGRPITPNGNTTTQVKKDLPNKRGFSTFAVGWLE